MITKLGQVTVETRGCSQGGEFDSPSNTTKKIYSDGLGMHSTVRTDVFTHTAANCNP